MSAERQLLSLESAQKSNGLLIVLVLSFLPYLGLGPIAVPSQVQPWAAIAAWMWLLGRLAAGKLTIPYFGWLLIFFGIWFMVYVYAGDGFDLLVYFRRSGAFLLSAGIVIAGQYLTPELLWRALRLVAPIWLFFAALRYLIPNLYFALVTPLVPTVVVSSERGSSSLAPEATDFGFTMVFLLVLAVITRQVLRRQGEQVSRWPLALLVLGAVLSQSGIAFFCLVLVILLYLLLSSPGKFGRSAQVLLLLSIAVIGFVMLSTASSSSVRGIDLLISTVQSPSTLMDTTASYRVVHNAVGFFGLFDSGLRGYGAGSFTSEGIVVYMRHGLGATFGLHGYYGSNVPLTLTQSPVSYFAVILLEYGAIGVIYIASIFTFALRSRIPLRILAVVLLFITWAQSFPAAWPPFWVLLGIMLSPRFMESKESEVGVLPGPRKERKL